jgi:hypothetical protein
MGGSECSVIHRFLDFQKKFDQVFEACPNADSNRGKVHLEKLGVERDCGRPEGGCTGYGRQIMRRR